MPEFLAPDGTRLYYSDEGRGLPVLALAGLTRNGGDFDHLAPHLAGVRLIRLDARGRGRSAWADPATYAVPIEARDALALLDHLRLPRVAVLGTSRGGLVGKVMAAGAPGRVIGLMLNDIGPVLEPEGLRAIEVHLGQRPAQPSWEEAARARAAAWDAFRDVPHTRWLHEMRNHYEETPEGLRPRYDPRLRDSFLAALATAPADAWELWDALGDLPVALLRGEASNILSRPTAAEMKRRRPDLIWAEVPGRGHVPFLDEPVSLDAVRRWLAACEAAAAGQSVG